MFTLPQTWQEYEVSASSDHHAARAVKRSDDQFSLTSFRGNAEVALVRERAHGLAIRAGAGQTHLGGSLLNRSDDFTSVSAGVSSIHYFNAEGLSLFADLSLSTENDMEDVEAEDFTGTLTTALRIPFGKDWSLGVGLIASTRNLFGELPVFPGVGLVYHPNPDLMVALGLPFSGVIWKASEVVSFQAIYTPLYNVNVEVTEQVSESFSFSQFYRISSSSFRLTDETQWPEDASIIFRTNEVGFSAGWRHGAGLSVRASVAWQFDYRIDVVDDDNDRLFATTDVDQGVGVGLSVSYHW